MKQKSVPPPEEEPTSMCDISRALSVVGDRWTLLIMREVGMGVRKFEEIQAYTGMSSHLLAKRLKRMEEEGLLERKLYSTGPPRYEYLPTRKGKELDAVSLTLRAWMLRWGNYELGASPAFVIVDKKGKPVDGTWQIPSGKTPFTFNDVKTTISPAFEAEREARRTAYFEAKRRNKAARTEH